jgi:hypothetical protein
MRLSGKTMLLDRRILERAITLENPETMLYLCSNHPRAEMALLRVQDVAVRAGLGIVVNRSRMELVVEKILTIRFVNMERPEYFRGYPWGTKVHREEAVQLSGYWDDYVDITYTGATPEEEQKRWERINQRAEQRQVVKAVRVFSSQETSIPGHLQNTAGKAPDPILSPCFSPRMIRRLCSRTLWWKSRRAL